MNSSKPIKLRGHHLICLHFFHGEGYSAGFVENLKEIVKRVEKGEELKVCSGSDIVCAMCPYRRGKVCFYKSGAEAEIRVMDQTARRLLRVKEHENVKWEDIWKKIPEIFAEWSKKYCKTCAWRKACEKVSTFRKMQDSL